MDGNAQNLNARAPRRNENARNRPYIRVIRQNQRQFEADDLIKTLIARMASRVTEIHRNMRHTRRYRSRELVNAIQIYSTKRGDKIQTTYMHQIPILLIFGVIVMCYVLLCTKWPLDGN